MYSLFRKKIALTTLALATLILPQTILASTVDLSSTDGFDRSCAALPSASINLKNNQERQAFVICHDVALVQNIIRFVKNGERRYQSEKPTDAEMNSLIRGQLSLVRDELRNVRLVLEKLKLKKDEGLLLAPAQWKKDLDGDGKLSTWEENFFAIPKSGRHGLQFNMPHDDPDYYAKEYQMAAKIRVDQSDILWSLSYHYFAESLLEIVLSYRLNNSTFNNESIELQDATGMQRAAALLTKGFKTSEAMRLSVLAETDDQDEWIANPRQKNSVFPLPLDAQDFQVWGGLLAHVIPLFEGKTLFAGNAKASGILGSAAKLCPKNQGLSIPLFFSHPPRYPMAQMERLDLSGMCKTIDEKHPVSGLFAFIEVYANQAQANDSGAMRFLRNLLWTN